MTDLLITIILSGFAITFIVELLSLVSAPFTSKEMLYAFLSLPLSVGSAYVTIGLNKESFVYVPAIAFVSLMLNKYLNKPVVMGTRLPRL